MTDSDTAENKIALITGASQRIGACITKAFHSRGYTVIIHYRESSQKAELLANELNAIRENSAHLLQADLCTTSNVHDAAESVKNTWGKLNVLVNNASTFYPTPVGEASTDDWDALINSNAKGPFFLSQALAPLLTSSNGSIINLVDIYSEKPMPTHTIYCMAKAAVAMMTKSLALELAPQVRVNGVSPGAILWPEGDVSETDKTRTLEKIPLKRIGSDSDIASLVTYLTEDAPYITGQIIAVDGGRSLNI